MGDFRTETIKAVKAMGITAKELGFGNVEALETICIAKSKRYDRLTTAIDKLINELDIAGDAREIIPEEFWEDVGIKPDKFVIVEVQLQKTVYRNIKVAVPADDVDRSLDEAIGDYDYLDDDSPDDEDDWEIRGSESDFTEYTAEEIKGKDDIWNKEEF